MNNIYDSDFYSSIKASGRTSAQIVAPIIMDRFAPSSVIDIGCGTGAWLNVYKAAGVRDIHGVDGDYVDPDMLDIPGECFEKFDLQNKYEGCRTYDLAMSLEVAEHLPGNHAKQFVASLVELAPVVLFSAAIPGQSGKRHINCQWPVYWADLFGGYGYQAFDCLRTVLWGNPEVDWWYQQNILLFINNDHIDDYPRLKPLLVCCPSSPLPLVHPMCLREALDWGNEQSRLYWELVDKQRD